MEPKVSFKRNSKGLVAWFFKSRKRYGTYPKTERAVALMFIAILILWAFTLVRWFVIIVIGLMQHFGIIA